jgi:hypothetical protein
VVQAALLHDQEAGWGGQLLPHLLPDHPRQRPTSGQPGGGAHQRPAHHKVGPPLAVPIILRWTVPSKLCHDGAERSVSTAPWRWRRNCEQLVREIQRIIRSAKEAQAMYGGNRWAGTTELLALLAGEPPASPSPAPPREGVSPWRARSGAEAEQIPHHRTQSWTPSRCAPYAQG